MKKIVIAAVLCTALAMTFAGAEEGIILETSGKVEIKHIGGAWIEAKTGQTLALGSVVSTGFGSRAKISIAGADLLVEPLSRLSVEELVIRRNVRKTDLNLRVGKVQVEIKKDPALKNDFTVRSPVSTAAVRGTIFTFDGKRIEVKEGRVSLSNNLGWARNYSAGQQGRMVPSGSPLPPAAQSEAQASLRAPAGIAGDDVVPPRLGGDKPAGDVINPKTTGTLIISW
jgi:hypothetical protein